MRWITLLLQLVSFRSSLLESRALIENARAAAERGKRAALFSGVVLLALVYFLTGSILLVVELGLQVDRGEAFRLSGLLGSALALLALSALIVGVGAIAFGDKKETPPAPPPAEPDLKSALEGLLVSFLTQLSGKLRDGKGGKGGDER